MSIITQGKLTGATAINYKSVEIIKGWLSRTLDKVDLNVPINIGSLARKTREVAHITKRGNQPYFERLILNRLEKDGYCKINREKREITFIKIIPILPIDLREKVMNYFDEGHSSKDIVDLIKDEAKPYVENDDQLKNCVISIKGHHTQGHTPS